MTRARPVCHGQDDSQQQFVHRTLDWFLFKHMQICPPTCMNTHCNTRQKWDAKLHAYALHSLGAAAEARCTACIRVGHTCCSSGTPSRMHMCGTHTRCSSGTLSRMHMRDTQRCCGSGALIRMHMCGTHTRCSSGTLSCSTTWPPSIRNSGRSNVGGTPGRPACRIGRCRGITAEAVATLQQPGKGGWGGQREPMGGEDYTRMGKGRCRWGGGRGHEGRGRGHERGAEDMGGGGRGHEGRGKGHA